MKQSNYIIKIIFFLVVVLYSGNFFFSTSSSTNNLIIFQDSTLSINTDSLNLAEGKKLYGIKCRKCHALYDPKEYKLKKWKENLDEMKNKAELTKEEYEIIYLYLKENYRK